MKNVTGANEVAPVSDDQADYPWGLRLHLQEEQLAALGVNALPSTGAIVRISATARVVATAEESEGGQAKRSLGLQITDMGMAGPGRGRYDALYSDDPNMRD